jgi:hypothetical protein
VAVTPGKDQHSQPPSPTVLVLADRRQSHTGRALKSAGYRLMTSFTADHAVALCVNNPVDAVVLDQGHFVVTDNWLVAQSLKMIKVRMCVILVVRGKIVGKEMPPGVDAVVADGDVEGLLTTLKQLL